MQGVAIGSSIGGIEEIATTARDLHDERKGFRRLSPFFVPRVLVNMAAGHVSINHGFTVRTVPAAWLLLPWIPLHGCFCRGPRCVAAVAMDHAAWLLWPWI